MANPENRFRAPTALPMCGVRPLGAACLALLLLFPLSPGGLAEIPKRRESCVILLHGLWRTAYSMKYLEWGLSERDFQVVNLTYPSLSHPIEELAVIAVEKGLAGCRESGVERIHFVTHSLGGILVRQYLSQREIAGLDRVVMLGPPSQGSQVADFVDSIDLLEPLTPRAVEQLGTGEDSVPGQLGPARFELGIIAGTANRRSFLPGFPEGPGDGTVSVEETVVPGMLDFLEMPVGHTFMMWDSRVLHQVVHFLERGYFDRSD
jgi:pimeloyl-ACP methyl ester carboxylesterase